MTYKEKCAASCEWCAEGLELCGLPDCMISARHHRGKPWHDCTAPTPEAYIEELTAEIQTLKSLITRRSGASSFEEWMSDIDLTEQSPLEIITGLSEQLKHAYIGIEQRNEELTKLEARIAILENALLPFAVDGKGSHPAFWYEAARKAMGEK